MGVMGPVYIPLPSKFEDRVKVSNLLKTSLTCLDFDVKVCRVKGRKTHLSPACAHVPRGFDDWVSVSLSDVLVDSNLCSGSCGESFSPVHPNDVYKVIDRVSLGWCLRSLRFLFEERDRVDELIQSLSGVGGEQCEAFVSEVLGLPAEMFLTSGSGVVSGAPSLSTDDFRAAVRVAGHLLFGRSVKHNNRMSVSDVVRKELESPGFVVQLCADPEVFRHRYAYKTSSMREWCKLYKEAFGVWPDVGLTESPADGFTQARVEAAMLFTWWVACCARVVKSEQVGVFSRAECRFGGLLGGFYMADKPASTSDVFVGPVGEVLLGDLVSVSGRNLFSRV